MTFKNSATQEQIDEFKATIEKEGKSLYLSSRVDVVIRPSGKIVHTYNIGSMRVRPRLILPVNTYRSWMQGFAVTSNEDTFNSFNNNLTGDSPIDNIGVWTYHTVARH